MATDRKYGYRGPDECFWTFVWEKRRDFRGPRWGWRAYRKKPGDVFAEAIGFYDESEVLHRLVVYGQGNPEPIEWDDLKIEVGLAMQNGGFEAFLKSLGESTQET